MSPLLTRIATEMVRGLILAYRYSFAAVLGGSCRYLPTCSAYALEAVDRYGAITGGRLAVARLLRCHPWGGAGLDPVPSQGPPRRGRRDTVPDHSRQPPSHP